jgi:hypothetical protein
MTNNWAALILAVTCWITPAAAQTPTPCPKLQPTTITVDSAECLQEALESNFTGTILIPSGATINLTGHTTSLPVKSGVHIKGTRNGLDPGALIVKNDGPIKIDDTTPETNVFVVSGSDVRIEGLRFQGPASTYKDSEREVKWLVNAIAVTADLSRNFGRNVVIENNSFWFWSAAVAVGCKDCGDPEPRMTRDQAGLISVTRNYFHRNAREGLGYGVVVGSGYVLIEGNLFTHNRHAVAHGGLKTSGYIARYNYILEGGFTEEATLGSYWNQHFDVHGTGPGHYGSDAGQYFEIAYNTIRGEQTYAPGPFEQTRPAFMLRGKPTVGASFHDNVVVHNDEGKAVRLKAGCAPNVIPCQPLCRTNEACNLTIGPNLYNTDTSSELAVGDFDGDGRDDIFLANGTGWWYSSAGVTEWQFLRRSPLRIKDLRFGRFDSDAKTDVLFIAGDWYVWSAGQSAAKWVRGDGTRLTDCVFGDFDGDGITDALRANGTTWSVAPAAQGPWIPRRNSSVAAVNLRTGDFKGAGHDQIFWIDNTWSLWDPVSNAVTRDHRKPVRSPDFASLVVADFDGDGRADVAQTNGNGWRWIRGGTNTWAPLRGAGGQDYYKNIREVMLGRFTGHRRLDAVRYEIPSPGRNFVVWRGFGARDAFEPWTPPLQEMR